MAKTSGFSEREIQVLAALRDKGIFTDGELENFFQKAATAARTEDNPTNRAAGDFIENIFATNAIFGY